MFNENKVLQPQPIKQEDYSEALEDGLQEMRNNGVRRREELLLHMKEVENRPAQIKQIYSVDVTRQNFPAEEALYNREYPKNFFNLSVESDRAPVRVETGNMVTVCNNREIFTDSLSACVACFIQGENTKSMIHMVSGNEEYNYGFWEEEGSNYAPASATVESVLQNINDLENTEDLKICIVSNEKRLYGKQQLHNLKKAFEENGVESVRIEEVPLEATLVYHSPAQEEKLLAIGRYYDGKELYAKSFDIPLEGKDHYMEAKSSQLKHSYE